MKYSYKKFADEFPEWKKKKDSWLLRHLYRPISFYGASIASEMGLTSNQVSFISLIVAIIASLLFLFPNKWINVCGIMLIFLWMIMDCIDGNLARSIKAYKYGDFIDAISSYTLIALLFPSLGINLYFNGGAVIKPGVIWVALIGSMSGIFDVLARLYYQKYNNNKKEYDSLKTVSEDSIDSKLNRINDRIGKELGLNGLLIPFLLVSKLFEALDIFTFFYFLFYGFRYLVSLAVLLKKSQCLRK